MESTTDLVVTMPFLVLLQKLDFSTSKSQFKVIQIWRQSLNDSSWQEVIDFKKQKINWRFKSRMRSNSNEFIEGFPFTSGNVNARDNLNTKTDKFSCNSSVGMIEEDDWDEEVKGTLVSGVATCFKIRVQHLDLDSCLQVSVWPTIRMPTGGSTIPLINTSFLFASRNHIEESNEIDFLVAQALVNGRKFIQASEKIRGIEARLLKQGTPSDIYRVMLLEIIIGESMSQHSQVSEKIFAFKRATLIHSWLSCNSHDVQSLFEALSQLSKEYVKQEEAPQKLFAIKQPLVQILIDNIGSHIEVVRMASLKALEYLLDTLNCSIEHQIVDILRTVCFCYPSTETAPLTQPILGFFQFDYHNQPQVNLQLPFFQWYAIHNETDCRISEVKTLSHSYVQSALNCYNHILENIGIVLASASHNLLIQVFKQIIMPQVLNPKLPQELIIYLLKYADQMLHICKGDLSLPAQFLAQIVDIVVDQPTKQLPQTSSQIKRVRVQSAQAMSPHFGNLQQVCLNLIETLKVKYFTTLFSSDLQPKNQKILEWLVESLSEVAVSLDRNQRPPSAMDQKKLNILISLVECVVQAVSDEEYFQIDFKTSLQNLYSRDEDSKTLEISSKSQIINKRHSKQLTFEMTQNLKVLAIFLPLTQPLILLLNFSITSQDRLPLFKTIWLLLIQIMSRLTVKLTRMPKLTLTNIIQPYLQQLNEFMQTSSPSKQMLEFLQIVLGAIEPPIPELESTLLPTLLQTIPHNLHDEVFQATSLMLEIYRLEISTTNISLLISVLVHKYTMRSKEHKMLVDKVVTRILLDQQSKSIFDCFLNECLVQNFIPENATHDDEQVFFEKLGLLQEVVHKLQEQHVWHFRRLLNIASGAFYRVFQINPRSKLFIVKLLLKMSDFFIHNCAPYNHYEFPIYQQALTPDIMQNQINRTINTQQRIVFPAQIQNPNFDCHGVYSEPSVELFSIDHHDFMAGGLDHRVEMDPQVAAYLDSEPGIMRRPQRTHYQSQQIDYRPQMLLNRGEMVHENLRQESELYESERHAILQHISAQIICNQVQIIDRDRLLLVKIHSLLIRQVVESVPQLQQCFGEQEQVDDASIKLCALNMMQNLFANLLAVPTLKNLVVQEIIKQERVNLVLPVRMQQVEAATHEFSIQNSNERIPEESQPEQSHLEIIPDFAEIAIIGQDQTTEADFPEEFECSNAKYQCARVLAFLKVIKYLENIITGTSWANLKSLAICVLNLGCQLQNVSVLPNKLQRHLKNALQPLIIKLIQNKKDSESRAAALHTLASICNLQVKQYNHVLDSQLEDSVKFRDNFNVNELISEDVVLSKHIEIFRQNSSFVSLAIWQEVFDLQDDQNAIIREASNALVRLCVPRESVQHFIKIKREQYKLKVNQILQKSLSSCINVSLFQKQESSQNFTSTMISQQPLGYQDDSEQSSEHSSSRSDFFITQTSTEQEVRSILQIFNLKVAPVLNLQADRTSQREELNFKRNAFQEDDQLQIDERISLRGSKNSRAIDSNEEEDDDLPSENSSDEVYIFRRQDSGRRINEQPSQESRQNVMFQPLQLMQYENEDLGIIDLDDNELFQDDDFEELDDDKLPVLKNTYSKKNRPNNSKSVAFGSRSQGIKTKEDQPEERPKKMSVKSSVDANSNNDLEYELSVQGGMSMASLPVANRRQIQSAGGKRSKPQSRQSSNLHMRSETLYLPTDLKDQDIEEVQIFVRRKQRPVSGRNSQQSSNACVYKIFLSRKKDAMNRTP